MHECPEVEEVLRARLFLDLRQAGLEQTALAGFQTDSFNLPGGNGFAVAFKAPKETIVLQVCEKETVLNPDQPFAIIRKIHLDVSVDMPDLV